MAGFVCKNAGEGIKISDLGKGGEGQRIAGGPGNNTLCGGNRDDILISGDYHDAPAAGKTDIMYGGHGDDVFAVKAGSNREVVIKDMQYCDILHIAGAQMDGDRIAAQDRHGNIDEVGLGKIKELLTSANVTLEGVHHLELVATPQIGGDSGVNMQMKKICDRWG